MKNSSAPESQSGPMGTAWTALGEETLAQRAGAQLDPHGDVDSNLSFVVSLPCSGSVFVTRSQQLTELFSFSWLLLVTFPGFCLSPFLLLR